MDRTFPRNTRRHVSWTLALTATAALACGPSLLSARADDLNGQKHQAQKGVKAAQANLEDSSRALYAATQQLQAAQASLVSAQATLASTEGQLTAAQVLDGQMQAKLVTARGMLELAVQEVAAARAKVADKKAQIAQTAIASYTFGDPNMVRINVLLQGADPGDVALQLGALDNLAGQQASTLQEYQDAQAQLLAEKNKVKAAEALIAEERQAAAINLAHKKVLEQQAVTARSRVVALVATRTAAEAAAVKARAADRAKLAASKRQEARIERLILAAARRHRGHNSVGGSGFLLPPVANSYITSPYGWRIHPIFGYWGLHDGDDFHAPCGVPEVASAAGTVVAQYYSDVWGNRLYLDVGQVNGKNMTLIYNHISAYRSHVGQHVARGQTVALAGTTGWSTACHLHFTVMVNGTAVDPQKYL